MNGMFQNLLHNYEECVSVILFCIGFCMTFRYQLRRDNIIG